ncbi:sucrase-isomaltase, intestinal-like [Artemia franciscana]|uniref:sucrase-isomaltase, intestinal-like n=1 Tax=Artemia franciscana TaxID=6661 RepID=UPI0032DBD000
MAFLKVLLGFLCLGFALGIPDPLTNPEYRVDCEPEGVADASKCFERGCVYDEIYDAPGTPWCFFPVDYGYSLVGTPNTNDKGIAFNLVRNSAPSLFGNDWQSITLEVEYQTNERLRVKISDGKPRWEVPITIENPPEATSDPLYEVRHTVGSTFAFQVVRKSTGTVIFDSSLGGLTLSDQFLQISTLFSMDAVFGFGENEQPSLRHDMNWKTWAFWGRDQPPDGAANMYGTQPYYTALEPNGDAHGVLILNSNAQEVTMTPAPGMVYRTIGGILDLYFFLGPNPEAVAGQFSAAVGRSFIPPYWALGFQICRYGYENTDAIRAVVDRTAAAEIPHDVQYGDIDIMDRALDFTISPTNFPDLPDYVKEIKSRGLKFATILDPCISTGEPEGTYPAYDEGNRLDVWMKRPDGTPSVGFVWPEDPTYFVDYSSPNAKIYWEQQIVEFRNLLEWDALWIDMNEPANFVNGDVNGCSENSINFPPYKPRTYGYTLDDKTVCPDHVQYAGLHYDAHNLYGWYQSEPTITAVQQATGKRGFALSRSTFIGSGKWVAHWLGDNFSNWPNLKKSIIGMLQFNLFAIPMVGPDICGFIGDTEEQLCLRWHQIGAFYPFSRNHNGLGYIEQDPAVWGEPVISSTKEALMIRYTILPYFYTQFYNHVMYGNTVARPLFHEFPTDTNSWNIDEQFLIGPAFMVSPVLYQDTTVIEAYFPDARWYSYYDGTEITARGQTISLSAPLTFINLHIRGGYVIPTQEPAVNTERSRLNPMGMIVALDDNEAATGLLFYDDGDSIDPVNNGNYFLASIQVSSSQLEFIVENNTYEEMASLTMGQIRIMGVKATPSTVQVNGANIDFTVLQSGDQKSVDNPSIRRNFYHQSRSGRATGKKLQGSAPPQGIPDPLTNPEYRVDCQPEGVADATICLERGCVYDEIYDAPGTPWCFFPVDYGYRLTGTPNVNDKGIVFNLVRNSVPSLFGNEWQSITLEVQYQTDDRLRVKISDGQPRWEVPIAIDNPSEVPANPLYEVSHTAGSTFSFQVVRKSTGTVIFDSSLGGLTLSDQFLQISTLLSMDAIFGFGENEQPSLRHDMNWKTWALWARDQAPSGAANMYGTQPYYTGLEPNGDAHGVLILNSNAQEVTMTPAPGMVYRTIGGILDLYFFLGPNPEAVAGQFSAAVGRSFIPPYWALGFQICRWGYENTSAIRAVVDRTAAAEIPHDVQYGDIDIMDRALDFTISPINFPDLPDYVKEIKSRGLKFATILDPGISTGEPEGTYPAYDEGNRLDVWMKRPDGTPSTGFVWPEDPTYFVDYSSPNAKLYWEQQIVEFRNLLEWDAIWIDMNEPANFVNGDVNGCSENTINFPPYKPRTFGSALDDKTVCPDHVQYAGLHYDAHSLYGWYQSEPTITAVQQATGKRGFALSRSTFIGSGKWVAHWLGDNFSDWPNLKKSIIGMLQFNLFAIPMVGADICGFIFDTEEQLCLRWHQLGAFYPFSRNHNGLGYIEQDPAIWGEPVISSTKEALMIRYTILPYIYTQFYNHLMYGNTVARPLFHEFPTDTNAWNIDEQFLLGPAFMVSPVLYKDTTVIDAYFPDARWYNYYDGTEIAARGQTMSLSAPLTYINLHIRGGHVIPTQEPAVNTEKSRQNPMGMIVALDDNEAATGLLFYDDGDSIGPVNNGNYFLASIQVSSSQLEFVVENNAYEEMAALTMGQIRIIGIKATPSSVQVNGASIDFTVLESGEVTFNAGVPANQPFTVSWM